jgi:hypothetical protein
MGKVMNVLNKSTRIITVVAALALLWGVAGAQAQEKLSPKCKAVWAQHKVQKCAGNRDAACRASNAEKRNARMAAGCPAGKNG